MEEINIKELLSYFLRKIMIIIIITIIAGSIGALYTFKYKTKLYKSDATILLAQTTSEEEESKSSKNKNVTQEDETTTQTSITINEKLVYTYSEIVKSRNILNQVIKDLNLKYTTEELSEMISVEGIDETEIIRITVESPNKEEATIIANKTAEVFENTVQQIYNLKNVFLLDEAIDAKEPYNDNKPKDVIIAALIGFVISVAFIFVLYYFDDTIKSSSEAEKRLGIPVIGQLPLNVEEDENIKNKTIKSLKLIRKVWKK